MNSKFTDHNGIFYGQGMKYFFFTHDNYAFIGINNTFPDLNISHAANMDKVTEEQAHREIVLLVDTRVLTNSDMGCFYRFFSQNNVVKIIWIKLGGIGGFLPMPFIYNDFVDLSKDLKNFSESLRVAIFHSIKNLGDSRFSKDEFLLFTEILNNRDPCCFPKFKCKDEKFFYRLNASISSKLKFRNATYCFSVIIKHRDELTRYWLPELTRRYIYSNY